MKRYAAMVCLLVAMVVGGRVQCQYSDLYYHRVGDTVEWKANNGYYSWWELQPFFEEKLALKPTGNASVGTNMSGGFTDSAVVLQKFYTPVPLKIIGLAGCPSRVNQYNHVLDTDVVQEYLYLYDADAAAFTQKAQVPWSPFDSCRYLHFWWNSMEKDDPYDPDPDSCCQDKPRETYLRLQEYYFDTAIWVTDSFYVGGSIFGNCTGYRRMMQSASDLSSDFAYRNDSLKTLYYSAELYYPGYACNLEYQYQLPSPLRGMCATIDVTIKYKEGTGAMYSYQNTVPFEEEAWHWSIHPFISLLLYPIVEVDTTVPPVDACPPVSNVQVTTSGTSATVMWDDFPNYSSVLLRYGLFNQPEAQWTEVNVTGSTLHTLTGLSEAVCYGVKMKALCDTCKKETPWTDVVEFYTGQDTTGGTEGIGGEATALSSLTYVQPNPARDEVRVTSSFNLRRLELHDLSGVMVYSEPASGHEKVLDVSWLRAGTYIMTIATHDGTTHKRLQIVR